MSYPFADRAAEDERLVAQATIFDPLTRRLLEQAGLAPGMRVLDLGSGAGDVARLAAELVGPGGSVVGIERDPAAVTLARRRTDTASVEFRVGDAQTLEGVEDGFDAVVGRLILMYMPDPVVALRRAATRVRPGGLVCRGWPVRTCLGLGQPRVRGGPADGAARGGYPGRGGSGHGGNGCDAPPVRRKGST